MLRCSICHGKSHDAPGATVKPFYCAALHLMKDMSHVHGICRDSHCSAQLVQVRSGPRAWLQITSTP